MNKQRKILITITYNEMGIIIDTKAEEVAQPNLQPTCNQLETDTISRQAVLDIYDDYNVAVENGNLEAYSKQRKRLLELPPAQPEITLESAIDYLHSIGWMQEHDRILTESAQPEPLRLRLDHELSKEEYERLKKDCAEQPIILLPKESAQPGCEDAVPRKSVEYICQKNTVSTNPYEHKYHDKFIQFMDDPEISDFGRWQHSNGFNTALVAVKCDLDKVPSVKPKRSE